MFVGREREMAMLNALYEKPTASLVLCRGRRRIGKSRLIREFGSAGGRFLQFQGLPPRKGIDQQAQLTAFAESLAQQTAIPKVKLESWPQAFALLASQVNGKEKTVILLDEVSWMSMGSPDFAGYLKIAWDTQFSQRSHLVLVVCGSVSTWLERNILNSTAFVGRLSLILTIDPLAIRYCNEFWGRAAQRVSPREKLEFLAVAGGVPRYLEEVRPHESAGTTIQRLCFTKEGFLFNEFESIWSDLFSRRGPIYRRIVTALADGPQGLAKISRAAGAMRSGRLAGYLDDLELSGFVRKEPNLDLQNTGGAPPKGTRYRIADPYVRFYLKQIVPKQSAIAGNRLSDVPLERIVNWDAVLGLHFETLILNNVLEVCRLLEIDPVSVISASPYFQRATLRRKGCQVDLLIQTRHSIWVCEIKCCRKIGMEIIHEMKKKVQALKVQHHTIRTVLIYEAELSEDLRSEGYFDRLLPFERFLRAA